jgi:hypothetical protein
MKRFFFALALGSVFMAGCTSKNYLIVLDDGKTGIVTLGKPHLDGLNFVYTRIDGRTNSIPSERVRAVTPYSGKVPSLPPK